MKKSATPNLPWVPVEDYKHPTGWTASGQRMHKNVSYRPSEDSLRGVSGDRETISRLQSIMRNYSAQVTQFLGTFLTRYGGNWNQALQIYTPRRRVVCGPPRDVRFSRVDTPVGLGCRTSLKIIRS